MKVEILTQKGHKFLWIEDYLWMWDIPIEQKIQKRIADQSYGDVLVAGYGLGIVQSYLQNNPNVTSITTIELYKEVIQANKNLYGKIYGKFVIGDFYAVPLDLEFDCIVGDLWQDIIPEQLENYKRFKNKAEQILKPNGKILAWGKDYFEYLLNK